MTFMWLVIYFTAILKDQQKRRVVLLPHLFMNSSIMTVDNYVPKKCRHLLLDADGIG